MTHLQVLDEIVSAGVEDVDIAGAALAIAAASRTQMDVGPYRAHLDEIAALAKAGAADAGADRDPIKLAQFLRGLLFKRLGYEGDRNSYDDLRNADMAEVIDRRRGLPVALGILYIHAARAAGGRSHGINFPGHFLVGVGIGPAAVLVDPFHGGRALDGDDLEALLPKGTALRQDHIAALTDRGTLIRLQTNIVTRARAGGTWGAAAAALEALTRLAPDQPDYAFQLGEALAQGDRKIAARQVLETALKRHPDARWASEAVALLAQLRRSLN